jgi:hypothetical protein
VNAKRLSGLKPRRAHWLAFAFFVAVFFGYAFVSGVEDERAWIAFVPLFLGMAWVLSWGLLDRFLEALGGWLGLGD